MLKDGLGHGKPWYMQDSGSQFPLPAQGSGVKIMRKPSDCSSCFRRSPGEVAGEVSSNVKEVSSVSKVNWQEISYTDDEPSSASFRSQSGGLPTSPHITLFRSPGVMPSTVSPANAFFCALRASTGPVGTVTFSAGGRKSPRSSRAGAPVSPLATCCAMLLKPFLPRTGCAAARPAPATTTTTRRRRTARSGPAARGGRAVMPCACE